MVVVVAVVVAVVVVAVVAVVIVMMPQAAVSRCSMQWPYWQEELLARQAEVDRLHATADATGHEHLVALVPRRAPCDHSRHGPAEAVSSAVL